MIRSIYHVNETSGERIYGIWILLGGFAVRQTRGVQRELLPAFAQNNQYAPVAHFGIAYLKHIPTSVIQMYFVDVMINKIKILLQD